MPKPAPAPLPLAPRTLRAEVFAAAAHAPCRERGDIDDATPTAVETDTAIAVLARHAPPSETQRRGVRLARRVIQAVAAGRRERADLSGTGKQRPSLSDFVVALTGNEPFTCRELIDRLSPYVRLNPKRPRQRTTYTAPSKRTRASAGTNAASTRASTTGRSRQRGHPPDCSGRRDNRPGGDPPR